MNKSIKSPFMVFQDFISPKYCDIILNNIKMKIPDVDEDGKPIKMVKHNPDSEKIIFSKLKTIIPKIKDYYVFDYEGTEHIDFYGYPEGMNGPAEVPHCENSEYIRKKWVKVHARDLTGVLWLTDYQEKPPIDTRYEVYGGKLEFPAYDFSLLPQKGTLIIYPAGPHFISAISPIAVGTLYQARINMVAKNNWIYQPDKFPGTYREWFNEYA